MQASDRVSCFSSSLYHTGVADYDSVRTREKKANNFLMKNNRNGKI